MVSVLAVSRIGSYGIAAGILVAVLAVLWPLGGTLPSAVRGADGRISTARVQAAMWTGAVLFALLAWLVHGDLDTIGKHSLQPDYLYLLGFPAAALVLAKGITTSKIANGTLVKTPLSTTERQARSPLARAGDLVTNDNGSTSFADLQFFLFNLVAVAYFFVAFFKDPSAGFPHIPDTLIALTGVSAATYLGNKAALGKAPGLSLVKPAKARVGAKIQVWGQNLGLGAPGEDAAVVVRIGDVVAPDAVVRTPTSFSVKVPEGVEPGASHISVTTPDNVVSTPIPFTVD